VFSNSSENATIKGINIKNLFRLCSVLKYKCLLACFNNRTIDYDPPGNNGWMRMTTMVALLVVSSLPPRIVKVLIRPEWSEPTDLQANWYPQRGTREGDFTDPCYCRRFFSVLEYFENVLPLIACHALYKIRYYGLCWELNHFLFCHIVRSSRVYIKYPNLNTFYKVKTMRGYQYIVPQCPSPWWVMYQLKLIPVCSLLCSDLYHHLINVM